MGNDFYDWLYEPVEWSNAEWIPRWQAIRRFVVDGLMPWIQRAGFRWAVHSQDLQNKIASGLYDNYSRGHMESRWNYSPVHDDWSDESLAHYAHVIGRDDWDAFWTKWGCWDDVAETEWRGPDRRADIEYFIWGQLDLESSPQMRVLYDIMTGGQEDDDIGWHRASRPGATDTYLQESVEYNGWAGYRR